MKIFEIRELPEEELEKRIRDEEENLVNLKFQKATSQLESPIRVRLVRRDIARMKTVLNERKAQRTRATAAQTTTTTTTTPARPPVNKDGKA